MLNDAQRQLVLDNYRLIGFTLKKYFSGGCNLPLSGEDLWQFCALALCEAARDYVPSKGEFSTIAIAYIRSALYRYTRGLYQDKRKANNCAVSLDALYECDHGSWYSTASVGLFVGDKAIPIDEKVCLRTAFEHCAKAYPTQAPYFNACLLKQMQSKAAAKALGVSDPTFRKHFMRYKAALANALS